MDEHEFLSKPHRLLREVLRNFDSFKHVCEQSGEFAVAYRLGSIDIHVGLTEVESVRGCILSGEGPVDISDQQRRALLLNVLRDLTQKEVGAMIGNIKPVVVGQHVEAACEGLARHYFPEWYGGLEDDCA